MKNDDYEKLLKENASLKKEKRFLGVYVILSVIIMLYENIGDFIDGFKEGLNQY